MTKEETRKKINEQVKKLVRNHLSFPLSKVCLKCEAGNCRHNKTCVRCDSPFEKPIV